MDRRRGGRWGGVGALACGLVALSLLLVTVPARAVSKRAPPVKTPWLLVRTGLLFSDTVQVDNLQFESTSDSAPALGVGAHYRTRRLDLGGFVEHIGSGRYQRLESKGRIGGQLRAAATLRWRYVEAGWGGLYVRLSPGLAVVRHADVFRFDVGDSQGLDLDDIEARSFGFAVSFDLGMVLYWSSRVATHLELSVVNTISRLRRDQDPLDYTRTRGMFVVGFELRP